MNRTEHKHVCCRLGGMLVGICLDRVQEINRLVEPTHVPLMPSHLRGLINLRGNLVTVIDLGSIVRGEPSTIGPKARTVVVELGEEVVGLVVDEVGDVVLVDASDRESLPSHLPAEQQRWFTSMVQLPTELLLLLDVDTMRDAGADTGKAAAR
jgi:purine-binding chemotaxis protein CheW